MKYKNRYIKALCAFFLSIISMTILFAGVGIHPFGDNTILVWDMDMQYIQFFSWFRNAVYGLTDPKYSLSGGFGSGTFGNLAYYLLSPFNLLLLFFDQKTLPTGILIITILKSAFMTTTMQIYLDNKCQSWLSVPFSLMYSMSSYVICFQFNIMWMDALLLLPIIIMLLEGVLVKRKGAVYSLVLGLCVLTNYFMGYMVCLFCLVYALLYIIVMYDKPLKGRLIAFFWFALYSVLGGGVAGGVILPTLYYLSLNPYKHIFAIKDLFSLARYSNPLYIIRYMAAMSFDTNQGITGHVPLVYCGVTAVIGTILFFFSKNVMKRTKLFYGVIFLILFVSLIFEGPYLVWHGLYSPTGCSWRFSFLFTFVIISISYLFFAQGHDYIKHHVNTTIVLVICYLLGAVLFKVKVTETIINISLAVMAVFTLSFYSRSNRVKTKARLCSIFSLICTTELILNALLIHNVQFVELYPSYSKYQNETAQISSLLTEAGIYKKNTKNTYRVLFYDSLAPNKFNYGFFYNVPSINMYSSNDMATTWNLSYNYGWGRPEYHLECDNNDITTITRAISGIRYVVTDAENEEQQPIILSDRLCLYEYEDILPLAFLVNRSALTLTEEPTKDLFSYQNSLIKALDETCEDVYIYTCDLKDFSGAPQSVQEDKITKLKNGYYTDGKAVYHENMEMINNKISEIRMSTYSLDSSVESDIKGVFYNPFESDHFVCFTVPYENTWTAFVDGKKTEVLSGLGGLVLVPIKSGMHEVRIKYHIPGVAIGAVISAISLFLVILLGCFACRNRKIALDS